MGLPCHSHQELASLSLRSLAVLTGLGETGFSLLAVATHSC